MFPIIKLKERTGYTLVELITAIVIAGIIYATFSVVISSGMDAWFFLKGQRSIMSDVSTTMKRMIREIRTTAGTANIIAFNATEYWFRDVSNNEINYQKNGSDLYRNSAVILTGLDSAAGLEFIYLDSAEAETTDKMSVRTVQITLTAKEGSNLVRLRSAAGIRNR